MSRLLTKFLNFLTSLDKNVKSVVVILFDIFVVFLAWFLFVILPAIYLTEFKFSLADYIFQIYSLSYTLPLITYLISMISLNGYREILRSFTLNNIYPIFFSSCAFFLTMMATNYALLGIESFAQSLLQAFSVSASMFLFIVISRIIFRTLASFTNKQANKNIYLYGTGIAAKELFSSLSLDSEIRVKAFISHDNEMIGRELFSKEIISLAKAIKQIELDNNCSLYIASRSISEERKKDIIEKCESLGIQVKKISAFSEMIKEKEVNLTDLSISDLLPRSNLDDFTDELNVLNDKVVLVTGAGGSIGSEICRILAHAEVKSLVIVEISEAALFSISEELRQINNSLNIHSVLLSVKSKTNLRRIFSKYSPDYVYHAAAYKHVPILEENDNYTQAIKNNFFGTCNVADVCDEFNVSKFIFISTDKAVRPSNIMGASKRLAELYLENAFTESKTIFSSVRFGNVLDSSGSVIPTFRKQIKNGGPVTVTHPDIIRYFMTIGEAAYLVILASIISEKQEVYMLKMGDPVKIDDLARRLIKLSGNKIKTRKDENGIEIIYTGLRPGEKLYEELLVNEEDVQTNHPKIFVDTSKTNIRKNELLEMITNIEKVISDGDLIALKKILAHYAEYQEEKISINS